MLVRGKLMVRLLTCMLALLVFLAGSIAVAAHQYRAGRTGLRVAGYRWRLRERFGLRVDVDPDFALRGRQCWNRTLASSLAALTATSSDDELRR
jgi:hypothetical protein